MISESQEVDKEFPELGVWCTAIDGDDNYSPIQTDIVSITFGIILCVYILYFVCLYSLFWRKNFLISVDT